MDKLKLAKNYLSAYKPVYEYNDNEIDRDNIEILKNAIENIIDYLIEKEGE